MNNPLASRGAVPELLAALARVVGPRRLLTAPRAMRRYTQGYRFGGGPAVAVAIPARLVELWRLVEQCVRHDAAIIVQAANTGLTGGSTPDGDGYDRPIVIISTLLLDRIHALDGGRQVLCHAGATLYRLEAMLAPLGREPHSVIGSSCIGASVVGGVCNNSGGALLQRGPAYTEYSLYAAVDAQGELQLVNELGIDLGPGPPDAMLERLEQGAFNPMPESLPGRRASDPDYAAWVRDIDASTPARFNADPRRLCGASGCAGKLVVFAVRLDTFARADGTRVIYVGTNDPADLTAVRRGLLATLPELPVAAEYLHRTAFDIADRYGKDSFWAIRLLGTARLPLLFRAKERVARVAQRIGFAAGFEERLLQRLSALLPDQLPPRLRDWRERYAHHLMIRCANKVAAEVESWLKAHLPSAQAGWFACIPSEGEAAFLHRFVAAGAAVRYRAVHCNKVEDIVALDIALPRNDPHWFETLPADIEARIVDRLYYGHFFCHVFHQDYLVARGEDPVEVEHAMWRLLDARGAEYPAEHNVGHLYPAKPALAEFYRSLDPGNRFNPGIGRMSKRSRYL